MIGFQGVAMLCCLPAAAAWHGHLEDHRPSAEVCQEHPEDHPVHEDGVGGQVHQG